MPGVFLSYRRVDTVPWAGRLFDHLARSFGRENVFMDIAGSIPPGADFATKLDQGLAGCDALLAVIGPAWLTCTSEAGTRRLDASDDWVRKEIVSSLKRPVLTMPVLFGGAIQPKPEQLPVDLHPLCARQGFCVRDDRWDDDVKAIIAALIDQVDALRALYKAADAAQAASGFELLAALMKTHTAVAGAVVASRSMIGDVSENIEHLEISKKLHDALHVIESDCWRRPRVEAQDRPTSLRSCSRSFDREAKKIRQALCHAGFRRLNAGLCDQLTDELALVSDALSQALATPTEACHEAALASVLGLVCTFPPLLDQRILGAARNLRLDRLADLMATVETATKAGAAANDRELATLHSTIAPLRSLSDELTRRVDEHDRLQSLDGKLRTICVGGSGHISLTDEWKRVRLIRERMCAPFTEPLSAAAPVLAEIEQEIESAVKAGTQAEALARLNEYFYEVGRVFLEVDSELKTFCLSLAAVSLPLKAMLAIPGDAR